MLLRVTVTFSTYLFFTIIRDNKKGEEYDGINIDNVVTLERLKQTQRKDYLQVRFIKSFVVKIFV